MVQNSLAASAAEIWQVVHSRRRKTLPAKRGAPESAEPEAGAVGAVAESPSPAAAGSDVATAGAAADAAALQAQLAETVQAQADLDDNRIPSSFKKQRLSAVDGEELPDFSDDDTEDKTAAALG